MSGSSGTADSNPERAPEQEVMDPIAQNIAGIIDLEKNDLEMTTHSQRWIEAIGAGLAQPRYFIGLLVFVLGWLTLNSSNALGVLRFDPPPFEWLQGLLSLAALLTTTIVLIGQARQSKLAAQRAHLDLQINLLTEQKVTKLIHLIDELRADLPGVKERHDPHVSQLKKPTDPVQLVSALKERDARRDSGVPAQPGE